MTATVPALMTAEELLDLYARQRLSPVEALQSVTERIARHNPRINAFVLLDPAAVRAAGDSERRWRAGRPIGPLDGVPVTVKDLLNMAGLPTRRGSRVSPADPAQEDAPVVSSLKAAGAVIVGKTTTTEYGWKTPGDCPSNGITRNPWDPGRTTGGSSSGAGAAGAASFGALHVGTDAGGSVRIPAAWCGLVGLKPTFGRVPQWPHGAFSGVACAGPMTRTVRDNALMFGAMARHDARDPFCLPDDGRDWRDGIEAGVAGLRVGLVQRFGFDAPVDADGVAAVEQAAALLAEAGAHVEHATVDLPDMRQLFTRVWGVALARLVDGYPPEARARLDAGLAEVAESQRGTTAYDMLESDAQRSLAAHAMARFHLGYDLVLCPTVPAGPVPADAPTTDPIGALHTAWAPWTFTFNLTRQPAITVPLGLSAQGMPRSVQIAAALFRDDLVYRAARVLEHAMPLKRAELLD